MGLAAGNREDQLRPLQSCRRGGAFARRKSEWSFSYRGTDYSGRTVISTTFLPDGTTPLPAGSNHYITLESSRGKKDASGESANWFCIVLNPVTGRPEAYRP